MKKIFATSFLITAIAGAAAAQNLSVGLRTGASCWMQRAAGDNFKLEATPGGHVSWDQEVFVRRETKGKWAFEGSLSHGSLSNRQTKTIIDDFPPYTFSGDIVTTNRMDNFGLRLSAQYDITCAHMQACPLMKHLRSYAGLSITPTVTYFRKSYASDITNIDLSGPEGRSNFDVWTGLSHTVIFAATKHFSISAVAGAEMSPARFFSGSHLTTAAGQYDPATRMSFRIGGAYRF